MNLNRREVLAGGVAALTGALVPLGAADGREIIVGPFAASRTISGFVNMLGLHDLESSDPWVRAINAELRGTEAPTTSEAEERSQALCFAGLAIWVIAPRALRRAGFEALAAKCENETSFRAGGAAACAQHTIGCSFPVWPMPPLALDAYGVSAHASTCGWYAIHAKLDTVVQTGAYCARALLSGEEDGVVSEERWFRSLATLSIEAAIRQDPRRGTLAHAQGVGAEADKMAADLSIL